MKSDINWCPSTFVVKYWQTVLSDFFTGHNDVWLEATVLLSDVGLWATVTAFLVVLLLPDSRCLREFWLGWCLPFPEMTSVDIGYLCFNLAFVHECFL